MSRTLERSVTAAEAGERVDRFLATAQSDLSRNRVQSLIREGHVRVNGRAVAGSRRLRAGDRVLLELPEEPAAAALAPEAIPLAVVFEDADVIVVDKPAGLVVHPGAGVASGTLAHALVHRDPAIASVGSVTRPGIVHRLDKDTSGLLVVARTAVAHRRLVEAMRRREVRRVYHALVWGSPRAASGTLSGAIGRDPRRRQRMALVRRGGKPAVTHWRVEERFGIATLLEVTLETGRTHQIRVHLADAGFPVIGDPVYGGRVKKGLSAGESERSLATTLLGAMSRQALHAVRIEFQHPVTGRGLSFTSAWPTDLSAAVERLRAFKRPRPV
jgi:23S rRNA pseudouridine1911/1915/1917 synthase